MYLVYASQDCFLKYCHSLKPSKIPRVTLLTNVFLFSLLNFFRFAKEFYGRPTDLTCFSWFNFSSLGGTTEKTTQDYIFLEYIKYYTYYAPHKGGILHLNYPYRQTKTKI